MVCCDPKDINDIINTPIHFDDVIHFNVKLENAFTDYRRICIMCAVSPMCDM